MVKQWFSILPLNLPIPTFATNVISYPSGRASRSEYWVSMLITFVVLGISLALVGVILWGALIPFGAIVVYWYMVVVRRMHDLNMTAWNLIWFIPLSFVPVLGFGAGVLLGLRQGSDDDNYYGHSPKYR